VLPADWVLSHLALKPLLETVLSDTIMTVITLPEELMGDGMSVPQNEDPFEGL
jgi:hypothetical protein